MVTSFPNNITDNQIRKARFAVLATLQVNMPLVNINILMSLSQLDSNMCFAPESTAPGVTEIKTENTHNCNCSIRVMVSFYLCGTYVCIPVRMHSHVFRMQ